jgi:hypothetical protein
MDMADQPTNGDPSLASDIQRQKKMQRIPSRARWFFYGAGSLLALEVLAVLFLYFSSNFSSSRPSAPRPSAPGAPAPRPPEPRPSVPRAPAPRPSAPGASATIASPSPTTKSPSVGVASPQLNLPEFPWPPPRASAETIIPQKFLRKSTDFVVHLGDVDHILVGALDINGYYDKSYYAVPDGFALVTRIEQINPDGTPKTPPARWELAMGPLRRFSLVGYLKVLLTASPGYHRIIVFIVTSHPFSQTDATVSEEQAINWLEGGFERLPSAVSELEFTEEYGCTSLVYEFRTASGIVPTLSLPSHLPGRIHLERANIWPALAK